MKTYGEVRYDEERKFFHRGDADIYVGDEQKTYKALGDMTGCTVLDVGGHIGWFTKYCIDNGATKVVAVEPDPNNIRVYVLNFPEGDLRRGAVYSGEKKTLALQLSHTYPANNRTDRPIRGRNIIFVDCVDFVGLMQEVQPDIMKVDIEGAEYTLNWGIVGSIKKIAIEYHQFDTGMLDKQRILHNRILAQGFKAIVEPKDKVTFQRITTGVYAR